MDNSRDKGIFPFRPNRDGQRAIFAYDPKGVKGFI